PSRCSPPTPIHGLSRIREEFRRTQQRTRHLEARPPLSGKSEPWGGPAVCEPPAGSRSDKILAPSVCTSLTLFARSSSRNEPAAQNPYGAISCRWRDPAALRGRPGDPGE